MSETLSELKSRIDIRTVIQGSVKLKSVPGGWRGLCPFHAEDSPSFYVFSDQRFHCFGCGARGDVFDWIKFTRNVTTHEAAKILKNESLYEFPIPIPEREPVHPINAETQRRYELYRGVVLGEHHLESKSLGVSVESLLALGTVWSQAKKALMFPMFDCDKQILGFRFRAPNGSKWSFKGGHAGLFLPNTFSHEGIIIFAEGPTDTAALLTLGIQNVIGRPSAFGGAELCREFVKRFEVKKAIVVSDNDKNNIGFEGAKKLTEKIGIPSRILRTRAKDIRASLNAGLTREQFLESIS